MNETYNSGGFDLPDFARVAFEDDPPSARVCQGGLQGTLTITLFLKVC